MRAFVAALFVAPALLAAGCLGGGPSTEEADVLATFYPLAFLAERIGGDDITVATLVPPGVEPHDWEPSPRDLARYAEARLVLAQGAGFEPWLDGIRAQLSRDPTVIATSGIRLLEGDHAHDEGEDVHLEEEVHADDEAHPEEGAHAGNETHAEDETHAVNETHAEDETHAVNETHAEDEAHANESRDAHEGEVGEEGEETYDPHTWLDPVTFAAQARVVEAALAQAFPEHAAAFAERTAALVADLDRLHEEFRAGLETCERRFVIASHDAYGYLEERYGFEVESIRGLSPEAEPDPRTVARLIEEARAHNVTVIYFEELVSDRVAQIIANEVGAKTLVLSPVEGLTPEARNAGADYLSLMRTNLAHLREGMGCA